MAAVLITLTPVLLPTGAATPLSVTSIVCSSVFLTADAANTNNIYLGGPTVLTTSGKPMAAGDDVYLGYDSVFGCNGKIDLSKIYFATDSNNNAVRIQYIKWESF